MGSGWLARHVVLAAACRPFGDGVAAALLLSLAGSPGWLRSRSRENMSPTIVGQRRQCVGDWTIFGSGAFAAGTMAF